MTESEWIDCRDGSQHSAYLYSLDDDRKLQLFYCACCRRAFEFLTADHRKRISQMSDYFAPSPGLVLGEVWEVVEHAVEIAERFANGLATDGERKSAAKAVEDVARHFNHTAACAPGPGDDPNYDDAAVKMGHDVASAAECAAFILPSAAERSVRVVANSVAYDMDAHYAGAHGDPGVDTNHPHMQARRAERAAQWKLLQDILGCEQ